MPEPIDNELERAVMRAESVMALLVAWLGKEHKVDLRKISLN